ncbi:ABC-type nitrate/sulfonate/bicarbonate transport system, permease component [Sphaerochaeta pleomorpha str. Grapes]|uniref:ABC-type nitrate/sulfonate/bicarbonate transport system, permease component n=1 Tax=Sphaerochaeta pleomorpha (strain ATCC BAA-1885 / DSM 22778 / Grapes) TaxID=158190 RepID=G8QYB0_SPHPG|nr:ABC transporter permease subunit [Sphaerochaeta pleomorpha]AEV30757.1 ABC-type nitrate/sulfonate/bicarbonate transport system, permease component [Sphaerochaeta pleomorpha str. Grapes]
MKVRTKRNLVVFGSSLLLIVIWQLGAMVLDSQILLPQVGPVGKALVALASSSPFALHVGLTVSRALESFFIIVISATFLGILAGGSPFFSLFVKPLIVVLKAVPVMSIILLAFIWFSSGTVPLFSAFLMGFPVMFVQIEQAFLHMDKNLEQMCDLYDFSTSLKIRHYVIPSLVPFFITGARTTLSMVWKVVIAAEVLTVPRYGVGGQMHLAQVQLDTEFVLSWTLVAILLTALGDLAFDGLVALAGKLKKQLDKRRLPCDL